MYGRRVGRLVNGRKIKVGVVFECPDAEYVKIADSPEVAAAAAEEGMDVDQITGMAVMPFAQLTVFRRGGHVESSTLLTKDELIRHIYEARAILKSMDKAAELADEHWAGYRKGVRRTSGDES